MHSQNSVPEHKLVSLNFIVLGEVEPEETHDRKRWSRKVKGEASLTVSWPLIRCDFLFLQPGINRVQF